MRITEVFDHDIIDLTSVTQTGVMMEDGNEWLERAESDFDDATYNLDDDRYAPGLFFLQQAAEKALKAVVVGSGEEPSYTHNLLRLAEEAGLPDEKTNYFAELNNLYTGVRYPGKEFGDVENIGDMRKSVREVLEWTRKQLKK
ncbi:MAG: HEPN domain-containing protein [Candidatus Nanohaloarchaea archaeon]